MCVRAFVQMYKYLNNNNQFAWVNASFDLVRENRMHAADTDQM